MPTEELIERVKSRLSDDFSKQLLDGALHTLGQIGNPVRAHQFAHTLRELITYILHSMAPDKEVMACSWYKQDPNVAGPIRRQRALYTCRGGLTDKFLKETLKLDPKNFHSEFSGAFQELHKRTHPRPDTLLTDEKEIEDFANGAIESLIEVFDTIDDVRRTIVDSVNRALHGEAMSAFVGETIGELDEISSHYVTGAVWIDEVEVTKLDAHEVHYKVTGSVDVTLQYGSSSDRAKDMGAEIHESFTYECTITAPTENPIKFNSDATKMKVDTKSWSGNE